jgi:signal peptidase I
MATGSLWYYFFIGVILVGILLGILSLLSLRIFVVEGNSMFPAFIEGDRVLVLQHWPASLLRREQVVICTPPHLVPEGRWEQFVSDRHNSSYRVWHTKPGFYLKRVIGLPGDKISLSLPLHNSEPYHLDIYQNNHVWNVPDKHLFVKGDNPGLDSTVWGAIPYNCLYGIVIRKFASKPGTGAENDVDRFNLGNMENKHEKV